MITVKDIFEFLDRKYPLNTACEFDNVGLLVGDGTAQVTSVVVALDCDINTVNAARSQNANLIITHHPVIFDGLKQVTEGSVVYELIKSGISVISMHTNLDIAVGGVTEQLCTALQLYDVEPFEAHDGFLIRSAKTNISDADTLAVHIKQMLGGGVRYVAQKSPIKRVLVCSGSGGDFLTDAIDGGFDALITADVKHNVFVDAINSGISVFDAGHYHSEKVIVKPLCAELSREFGQIKITSYISDCFKSI